MIKSALVARLFSLAALFGEIGLLMNGFATGTLALFGAGTGGVIGLTHFRTRGLLEGFALGLVIGLTAPIWYCPLSWALGLPGYPPGR